MKGISLFLSLVIFGGHPSDFIQPADGYRILMTAYANSKTHKGSLYPLGLALAKRGHEVGIFCEMMERDPKVPKEIIDEQIVMHNKNYSLWTSFGYRNGTEFQKFQWTLDLGPTFMIPPHYLTGKISRELLTGQPEDFDRLIYEASSFGTKSGVISKQKKPKWDLVLVDTVFSHLGIAAAERLNREFGVPYIAVSTADFEDHVMGWKGMPLPLSTYTSYFVPCFNWDHTRFTHRVKSLLGYAENVLAYGWIMPWVVEYAVRPALPSPRRLDYVDHFARSASYFTDLPDKVNYPRPIGPEILITSTSSCRRAQPQTFAADYDQDLKRFLDDPTSDGNIIIAFGTQVDWSAAPLSVIEAMAAALTTFRSYRIVWQFDNNPPANLPSHIRTQKWLPQPALLSDPRTKLFISHGGLKSFKENLCSAMPVIYIPLFGDQSKNAQLARRLGYGDVLSKYDLTREVITDKIRHFLDNNRRLKTTARHVRDMSMDTIVGKEVEGAFRTEFVIRHGGLPRLMENRAKALYFWQYYYLDLLLLVLILLLFTYTVFMSFVRLVCCPQRKL